MKNNRKFISIILCILGICCLVGALYLIATGLLDKQASEDTFEELRASRENYSELESLPLDDAEIATPSPAPLLPSPTAESSETATPEPTPEPTPVAIENPYRDSFLANDDMVAWLQIPDTVIDYPVMWTPDDETYYLYRDFNGKSNKNGCLLLDTDSSLDPLTTNLIIHGHNMKSGAMFGNLTDYEKKSYFETHREMYLYTEDCCKTYEVIAVFRSQVFKKSDNVFKFYKFFQADTQEEFDDFYNNIKSMSLYDTDVSATFGDRFITLSTCVYHVTNGRFVVVAKETGTAESYLPFRD
ncbi:MAG: class B sortase [Lachnospiraceae bacterium]|nr:class B sortase [Lachnospiraceae bacterium]